MKEWTINSLSPCLRGRDASAAAGLMSRAISFGGGNRWIVWVHSLVLAVWFACGASSAVSQTQSFNEFRGFPNPFGPSVFTIFSVGRAGGFTSSHTNSNSVSGTRAVSSNTIVNPNHFEVVGAVSTATVNTSGTYTFNFSNLVTNGVATSYLGVNFLTSSTSATVGAIRALPDTSTITTLDLMAGDRFFLGYDIESPNPGYTTGQLFQGSPLITITLVVNDPNEVLAQQSAETTGTFVPGVQSGAQVDINNTALNALHNQRVVRARSRMGNPRAQHDTLAQSDRHLSRYLQFAGGEGLTVRQALGLEDVPASYYQPKNQNGVASTLEKVFSIEQAAGASLSAEEPDRWELYTVGDFGVFNQDALDTVNRGYDSNTWAASVGVEYMVSPMLNIGTAFTYADNDTDLNEGLGNVDIEGQLYSVYATMFKNAAYLDLMYSYGDFENTLVRNTQVAGNATGTPDSDSHTFSVNAGKNVAVNGLVTGPTIGFDYTEGTTDAYNETGGGIANLNYQERQYESAISSLGWHVSKTKEVNAGILTLQGFASWDHEYSPDEGPIQATLANFGAVNLNQPGAAPGTDWMTVGLGVHLATECGWDFTVDYQTQLFREDVEAHYVGLKAATTF